MRRYIRLSVKLLSVSFVAVLLITGSQVSRAQDWEFVSETLTPYPSWIEYYSVSIFGDYLYTHSTHGPIVFDISDPTEPDSLGETSLWYTDWDRIIGTVAYADEWESSGFDDWCYDVCSGPDSWWYGTSLIDLSDPLDPQFLGYDSVSGWYAFEYADEEYRLFWYESVYDDTLLPGYLIGPHDTLEFQTPPKQADLTGATARILTDDFFYTVQVNADGTMRKLDSLSLPGLAYSFVRVDSYAYVLGSVYNAQDDEVLPGFQYDYLATLSVRHPLHMRILNLDSTVSPSPYYPGGYNLQSNGNELLFEETSETIAIYDLNDPARPKLVGQYKPIRASVTDFKLDGSTAYVTTRQEGLHVVDITDPTAPQKIGQFPPEPEGLRAEVVYGVTLVGDLAYVSTGRGGLKTLDLSNPYEPQLASEIEDGTSWWAVVIDEESSRLYKGRAVYDLSDPRNPILLDSLNVRPWNWICIADNIAYITRRPDTSEYGTEFSGYVFESYDITIPSAATRLSVDTFTANRVSLDIGESYAFLSIEPDRYDPREDEIRVYDISDPSDPQYYTTIETDALDGFGRIAAQGDRLYYFEAGLVLRIADFSDPNGWRNMGHLFYGEPPGMTAAGDTLFLAHQDRMGTTIVDVSDPMNPIIDGTYRAPNRLNQISVGNNLIAVAAQTSLILLRPALATDVGAEFESSLPDDFALKQNYPNPFNPSTTISYSLPSRSDVSIEIFNLLGQRVATMVEDSQTAGDHSVVWNASDFASGVYLYRMSAGDVVVTRKMTLIK